MNSNEPLLHLADVERLLPHRPPLLLVDRVWSFEPQGALVASRELDPGEDVFRGHLPGSPIWPGVFTIEGLAQACALHVALSALHPWRPGRLREAVQTASPFTLAGGMLAAADVRLMNPVFPGQRLGYRVSLERALGAVLRFHVDATESDKPVARGTITVAGRER